LSKKSHAFLAKGICCLKSMGLLVAIAVHGIGQRVRYAK
jgi:hypothetical protein